jgi:hypothetical protein
MAIPPASPRTAALLRAVPAANEQAVHNNVSELARIGLGKLTLLCPAIVACALPFEAIAWREPIAQTLPAVTVDRPRQKLFLMRLPLWLPAGELALADFADCEDSIVSAGHAYLLHFMHLAQLTRSSDKVCRLFRLCHR